ncbi:MAG: hypothetical protein A2033_14830 [Bacteroidetes bacterium GWA2_31_9]|nr:MAG: hypothetical protein A2033_14830 [Bacteroidetes bacterium GWA2_31_9]
MQRNSTLTLVFIIIYNSFVSAQKTESFLPKPTGKYFIGTKDTVLIDSLRKEIFTSKKSDFRNLPLKIWYPSDSNEGKSPDFYLQKYSSADLYNAYKDFSDDSTIFAQLQKEITHSYTGIRISNQQKTFPVIIFSQGFFFGLDEFYTQFMEELASNGYIVISITHPYDQQLSKLYNNQPARLKKMRAMKAYFQWKGVSFFKSKNPDVNNVKKCNRMLRSYFRNMRVFDKSLDIWIADSKFVLNSMATEVVSRRFPFLENRADTSRIGSYGQSFGGAVAGQLSYLDNRVKAAVNLDGFQFGDIYNHEFNKPIMSLQSDMYADWIVGNQHIYSKTKPYTMYVFKKSKHFIFSDCSLFPVMNNEHRVLLTGDVDGVKTLKQINSLVLDFFNHFLKAESSDNFGKSDRTINIIE